MKICVNILFISLLISVAYPCSCLEPSPPEEAYELMDVVFSGEVIDVVEDWGNYFKEVSINILDVFFSFRIFKSFR